jgi:hypothetical protein
MDKHHALEAVACAELCPDQRTELFEYDAYLIVEEVKNLMNRTLSPKAPKYIRQELNRYLYQIDKLSCEARAALDRASGVA